MVNVKYSVKGDIREQTFTSHRAAARFIARNFENIVDATEIPRGRTLWQKLTGSGRKPRRRSSCSRP